MKVDIKREEVRMSPDISHQTCSTFLPSDVAPNPYYYKVDDLWTAIEEDDVFDQIAGGVEQFIVDGVFDEAAFLQWASQYDGQIDALIDVFEDAKDVDPVMPPAPSPKVLYNRVAEVEVVDLGSGDCQKLSVCQAKKIVAVDKEPVQNVHYEVNELNVETELRDFMEQHQDKVLTSFNSLSQMVDVSQVEEFDGVHIVPDIEFVKTMMSVDLGADGVVRYGKFKDVDNGLKGDVYSEGYNCVNTFARRKVRLKPVCSVNIAHNLIPQVKDVYYSLINSESTPKYDGECMFLIVEHNRPFLCRRNGKGFRLQGESPSMVLMLEKLPLEGKPECFVLLRVLKYREYYPFHGLENLKRFCKQVRVQIGGKKIYAPGSPELAGYDSDGVIYRVGQLDLRYKGAVTIDVDDVVNTVNELEKHYGYAIKIENPQDGLCEYTVHNNNGNYVFIFKRTRTDKVGSTSIEKISRMMQWA